jgi:Domain of unknown function (DUF4398)
MNDAQMFQSNRPALMKILPAALLASLLVLSACASVPPPTEQLAVATAALANAVSAGGPEFAAVDMRNAREKLDRANLAMTAKNYDAARSLAEEAQVDAQLAGTRARTAKAKKASAELQEDSRVLREEISRKAQ